MYFSLLIYIWIDFIPICPCSLDFLLLVNVEMEGWCHPQLNYCKLVESERNERSRQWRNYIGLQNGWLWLFHVIVVVSHVRSLWTAERPRTAGWSSRVASSNAQGYTLPCARRQAAMANRYSLLEWGIPKSTHPNNEIRGICKQWQASMKNVKTVFECREKEVGKPKTTLELKLSHWCL